MSGLGSTEITGPALKINFKGNNIKGPRSLFRRKPNELSVRSLYILWNRMRSFSENCRKHH